MCFAAPARFLWGETAQATTTCTLFKQELHASAMDGETAGILYVAHASTPHAAPSRTKSPLSASVAAAHPPECSARRAHLNRKLGLRPLCMGPRNAVLGGGDACERGHWGLWWSSRWGHETCEGCAKMRVELHAGADTGAFGGAPNKATKSVRVRRNGWRKLMSTVPLGTLAELPMMPRTV